MTPIPGSSGPVELVSQLLDDLAGAWLFGSAARGDGDRDSDIDLVASRSVDNDQWAGQASGLISQGRTWTGNPVQLVEHTRRSFTALVGAGNPLVTAIRADGIALTPKTRQLLRDAA